MGGLEMISKAELEQRRGEAAELFDRAGIVITEAEKAAIEIADFGLNEFETTGLGVLVYVNTERVCAKELAMWPRQTCPEHRHPSVGESAGKEETFRCRWGRVLLYVPGEPASAPQATPPAGHESAYTVWHEVVLEPGDQYTLVPNTLHWFQAGPDGAVVSEFSTHSTDEADVFTDDEISRLTVVR
jgi:D-lyxose ketol-isomerase